MAKKKVKNLSNTNSSKEINSQRTGRTAAQIGKANKAKGSRFELEVVHKLKELGYDVCTSRSESKTTDDQKIDIFDLRGDLPVNIQTKYQQSTPNYFTIQNECPDKSKPFAIIWKKAVQGKKSPGTVAIMDVDFFYDLIKNSNLDTKL